MLRHQPIMAKEVVVSMPVDRKIYVDGTFGHGGHVEFILTNIQEEQRIEALRTKRIIAIDRDEKMLEKGKALVEKYHANIEFVRDSYKNIVEILK